VSTWRYGALQATRCKSKSAAVATARPFRAGRVLRHGSGFGEKPDPDALRAARGQVIAEIDRLNANDQRAGSIGRVAVEVYLPLEAGTPKRRVGVLEIYLPYGPISRDIASGLRQLYFDLAVGLALVYLALFLITASVSRGLRRELKLQCISRRARQPHRASQPPAVFAICHRDAERDVESSAIDGGRDR